MNIYIGCDHRGVEVEDKIANYLSGMGLNVIKESLPHNDTDDYPDFAFEICDKVLKDNGSLGVLLCGTGIGMSIAANKVKGIRAARCVTKDDAFYARQHNNANVICIGIDEFDKMCEVIDTFIATMGASEDKHLKRIEKITKYEDNK